jgi:hypothetical protein
MSRIAPLFAWSLAAFVCSVRPVAALEPPVQTVDAGGVRFAVQTIDRSLKVGYAVRVADVNGDKKPDIVVCDAERVIWFENPAWTLHTIVDSKAAGIKTDNVCIDLHDINGDGKLDCALGADWQPGNTAAGGSLHWLRQPADGVDKPWTHFPIEAPIPTLHRIYFADLDADGKAELLVGPLKGKGSTGKANFTDVPAPLLRYKIPANVDAPGAKWESENLTESLHVMHNFLPSPGAPWNGVITASYEGLSVVQPDPAAPGKWVTRPFGVGDQANPKASRGCSEVKRGQMLSGDLQFFATIDPFHGNQAVVYGPENKATTVKPEPWHREVLDDTLKGGHSIGCADFDGDGDDEVVAGWRDGEKTGINLYQPTRMKGDANNPPGVKWQKFPLDPEIAAEDLWIADLDADGKPDIVACGRRTKDVKIYWNKGKAQ